MGLGVDGVILSSQVISRIVHLHSLNRVYCVIRDDHGVTFLVREAVVAIIDVQLLQPIYNMIFQLRHEILTNVVSKVRDTSNM